MLSADESAELRELQAKAYGRDGALSVEELARLRELEPTRSRNSPAVPIAEPVEAFEAGAADPPTDSGAGQDSEPGFVPGDPSDEPIAERVEASAPAASRPRWALIVAASAALVLGVGIGWLVFGRDPGPAIPVTAEQQIRGEQLAEESNLDPGTIVPMAESSDVLVWMGTRDEGEITCLIIEDGEHDTTSCAETQSLSDTGLYAMLSRDAPPESGNGSEMISASLGFAREDEPVVMIQRGWTTTSSEGYLDQFTDPEQRATAARLIDQGLDEWSPMLVAYDGDTPIWIGTRDQSQEACLFYGGEPDAPSACGSIETAQTTGVGMSMLSGEGDTPSGVSVTLRYTEQMMPSIVISPVPEGSLPTIDPETGDPIEFTFDDPTFDDLVTDGETGTTDETGG